MELQVEVERHALAGVFRISRSVRTEMEVVVASLLHGGTVGRGECAPNKRYDETPERTAAELAALDLEGLTPDAEGRARLAERLDAGSARNAVDCALWDLEAKLTGVRVVERAGVRMPDQFATALTLSIDTAEAMAAAAHRLGPGQLLKVKLDGDQVVERVTAIALAVPGARLIVDANEAWSTALLRDVHRKLAELGVVAIEQPLPSASDEGLRGIDSEVPLIADESCHVTADLERLAGLYDGVNIKLDKTGGLTEALRLAEEARARGMALMVGCMLGTSLAMAPASLLAADAVLVDLDAPFLIRTDRMPSMVVAPGLLAAPVQELWG